MDYQMELVNLTSNYFELFGLTAEFDIDQKKLSEQYRLLQNAVHPDKFTNASDYEQRLSMQQSARINEAYQVLKKPLSRAQYLLEYLLEGNNQDPEKQSESQMDSDFLMQQMELREKIDTARTNQDSASELVLIANDIRQKSKEVVIIIKDLFADNKQNNLQKIAEQVRRLQFLSRVEEEISDLEVKFL